MSTGFRIFLLILVSFGAVWTYRFRSVDIHHWLREMPREASGGERPFVSPLDGVLDPDLTFAEIWIRGRGTPPEPGELPSSEPPGASGGERAEPDEAELLAADLPAEDGFAAESGAGGGAQGGEEAGAVPGGAGEPQGAEGIGADRAPATAEGEASGPEAPDPLGAAASHEEIIHVLQPGESLWEVASRFLGSGARYREIREWNRDVIPDGTSDRVPAGAALRIRVPAGEKGLKVPEVSDDITVEKGSAPASPQGDGRATLLHTVKRNENLQRIAQKYYPDDRDGWRTIFAANKDRIPSPDRLREGQVLKIPEASRR